MNVVYKYKPETGFDTPELCHIVELLNNDTENDCSVARATVKPGVTTKLHYLSKTIERYVIIEGNGVAEVNGENTVNLNPFDVVVIPAEFNQRITNIGDKDLVFLCICTPRFTQNNYVQVE